MTMGLKTPHLQKSVSIRVEPELQVERKKRRPASGMGVRIESESAISQQTLDAVNESLEDAHEKGANICVAWFSLAGLTSIANRALKIFGIT